MKITKRILAVTLCGIMIAAMSVPAFADETRERWLSLAQTFDSSNGDGYTSYNLRWEDGAKGIITFEVQSEDIYYYGGAGAIPMDYAVLLFRDGAYVDHWSADGMNAAKFVRLDVSDRMRANGEYTFIVFVIERDRYVPSITYDGRYQRGYISKSPSYTVGGSTVTVPIGRHSAIAANDFWAFAVKNDNTLWAWNQTGSPVKDADNVVSVSVSTGHIMFIRTDGSLWGFGINNEGQLGDGTTTDRTNPESAVKVMDGVAAVSAGNRHTLAVKTDGSLWAWGQNLFGQLGDGTTTDRLTPVKIMDGVAYASAGQTHSAAIKTDGTLWIWGADDANPMEVMRDVVNISAGRGFTLAITADKTLWTVRYNTPDKLLEDVIAVSSGGPTNETYQGFRAAVTSDGGLWVWGGNIGSRFGGINAEPTRIMEDAVDVVSGSGVIAVLKPDGSVWSWGMNGSPPAQRLTDVKLPGTATPPPPPSTPSAIPYPNVGVTLDGAKVPVEVYGIDGRTFLKLSDLAIAVGISATWDGAVQLDSTKPAGSSSP
ncbi:MAG: hypothetical protein FWG93_05535, partial [Oscillospiraceae bacterium]|nr:hypothetical protein [Oscillospiraceae bacterium]